jgi:hypothetical protein
MTGKNKIYLVLAPKRSGHHALVGWVKKQFEIDCGPIQHINNAYLGWEQKKIGNKKQTAELGGGNYILSIEDFDIADWTIFEFNTFPILKQNDVKVILVTRSFENWLTSCLKRQEKLGDSRDVYESLDKEYLNDRKEKKPSRIILYDRYFIYYQNIYNKIEQIKYPNFFVVFDQWFSSIKVRKRLAKSLNLNFTDAGLNEVRKFGGGSSFDSDSFNGKAQEMKVLERFKICEKDPEYLFLMSKHKQIKEKSNLIC